MFKNKALIIVVLSILGLFFISGVLWARDCIDYNDYLHWVGSCDSLPSGNDVAVVGKYAYVASDYSGLQVIDISDPYFPVIVGNADPPGRAWGVAVEGNYAYVAEYYPSSLQVIDISDPYNPVIEGSVDMPDWAYDVAIDGNYAYVADYRSGLQVIDISNPSSPIIVGSVDTPGYANDVAVEGSYAYVADGSSGLQVINILDPYYPFIVEGVNTPDYADGVAVEGNYAYVADGESGLQVIDISDPSAPVIVASIDTPDYAWDVAVAEGHAYIADGPSGLQVIDISTPYIPIIVGISDGSGNAYSVVVEGDYAYVTKEWDYGGILQVIDISNPNSPVIVGNADTPGLAYSVEVVGRFAYVADYFSGLQVIEITDESSPTIEGSVNTPGYARGVAVEGFYAYVADYEAGLQVIDIFDPYNPSIVGSVDTPAYAEDVEVAGSYAFIANGWTGLYVIDISDPSNPVVVGSVGTPEGYYKDVEVVGNYAYVADNGGWYSFSSFQVIDISDPSNPVIVGNTDTPGPATGVAIVGNYAYVADGYSGLQVIDITNPLSPSIIGNVDTQNYAQNVEIVGSYAYVADYGSGLQVIDISNPSSPSIVGSVDTPQNANDVAIAGIYAYVADGESGLQIFSAQCEEPPFAINVEVDWLIADDHDHQPRVCELDDVMEAFARNGYVLNIELSDPITETAEFEEIDFSNRITRFDEPGEWTDDLESVYRDHPAGSGWHYMIFGHRFSENGEPSEASGIAEILGDEFLVSLGDSRSSFDRAGTFMHELGHNLSLWHMGRQDLGVGDLKPNYASVMSYRYMFRGVRSGMECQGIVSEPTTFWDLDYSQGTLLSLDEAHLIEEDGIGFGGVDWDCSGGIGGTIANDVSNRGDGRKAGADWCEVSLQNTTLIRDNNDWDLINDVAYNSEILETVHETVICTIPEDYIDDQLCPQPNPCAPSLYVMVVPDATTIPRGGTLDMWVYVTNQTSTQRSIQFWTNVTLPNGNTFPADQTLVGPISVTIPADITIYDRLSHTVHLNAPLGTYTYHAFIGRFPNTIDRALFEFTVINSQDLGLRPTQESISHTAVKESRSEGRVFELYLIENTLFSK